MQNYYLDMFHHTVVLYSNTYHHTDKLTSHADTTHHLHLTHGEKMGVLDTRTHLTSIHPSTPTHREGEGERIPIWSQPRPTWSSLWWTAKAEIHARMVSMQEWALMDDDMVFRRDSFYDGKIGSFLWRPPRRVRANQGPCSWRQTHYTGPRRRLIPKAVVQGNSNNTPSLTLCTSLSSSFTIPSSITPPLHVTRATVTVNFLLSYTSRTSSSQYHSTTTHTLHLFYLH